MSTFPCLIVMLCILVGLLLAAMWLPGVIVRVRDETVRGNQLETVTPPKSWDEIEAQAQAEMKRESVP